MSRHSHMDLAGDILVACFKLSHFHHQLDFWNYQRNLCLMALLYCLGFNSCFFFSFRRGLLATSLFCKARGLWGRLVRQSPRGELSVESSRVRADSSVSCLSSLPLWPSLTPLSPLIAVTIVILCVLPAGLCNPPPPPHTQNPHPASHNHPSPTHCHLCFEFCMTSSFIDDGLYVLKSSAGHSKKGFPVPAEAQTQKDSLPRRHTQKHTVSFRLET